MADENSSQDSSLSSSHSASGHVATGGLPQRQRIPLPWERQYSPTPSRLPRIVKSNLCDICLAFEENFLRPPSHEKDIKVYLFPHHASWEALELSSRNGCELCTLFRNGYLEQYYSRRLRDSKDSTDEAADTTMPDHHKSSQQSLRIRCEIPTVSSDPIRCCFINIPNAAWFNIGAEAGSKPADEGRFRGRICSATPDLSLAKEWIRNCHSHGVCTRQNAVPREHPTRLLQILNGSSQVRLMVTVDSDHYEYATLSHRWGRGDRKPPLTLQENLLQHMSGLTTDTLPPTFRDAVFTTASLGYEYLWIDSLCIIQDDPQDFERECPKMASVYSGSAVTIAAPGAQDSFSGFLQARKFAEDPLYTPVRLQYRDQEGEPQGTLTLWYPGSTSPGRYGYLKPSLNSDMQAYYGHEPRPPSFLDNRGWTFQEWLLSPRVLYFGSFQMYFECFESQRFEMLHDAHKHIDHFNLSKIIPPLTDHEEYYSWWHKLVMRYSTCALSIAKDRLPAISGIAHSYQPPVHNKYLAGIWQGDLPGALLWHHDPLSSDYTEEDNISSRDDVEYIAPTWSWASLMGPIKYMYKMPPDDRSENPDPWKLQVLSASTSLTSRSTNPDPFGPVSEGYLRVRGNLHKGAVFEDWNGSPVVLLQKDAHLVSDEETPVDRIEFDFHSDRPWQYDSLPRIDRPSKYIVDDKRQNRNLPEVFVLPILVSRNPTFHSCYGLALKPVPGVDNEFYRVGWVNGSSKPEKEYLLDGLFSCGDERELVIR